jgi:pimeloyl-ACP methyl ester carboxylesterase
VRSTTDAVSAWLPALLLPGDAARSEDPRAYAALGMPLIAIWGELDTITPLAQGQRLITLAPKAELQTLPAVGHIPQIEAPEAFNALLLKSVARIAAAR